MRIKSGNTDGQSYTFDNLILRLGLDRKYITYFKTPLKKYTLEKGKPLYQLQDKGNTIYLLQRGLIKLVHYTPNGKERIIRLLYAGDLIGLEVLFDTEYKHNAITLQDVIYYRLPLKIINELNYKYTPFHKTIIKSWHRSLISADKWITEFSTGTARKKIARFLIYLINQKYKNPCPFLHREDIGSILDLTTETTSRIFAEFHREGIIIQFKDKAPIICNIQELENIAFS